MQQGAATATQEIDVISMAQERMTALMSSHKQAEVAFDEVEDIIRQQLTMLNKGGMGLDLDVDAGTIDTASPGASNSKNGSFSQEVIVTSKDQKVFSFLLFYDTDREVPATGKISDVQNALARAEKMQDSPVLTVAVRDYNEIPPYQVLSSQGPVPGMTPSKLVASQEFETGDAREGLEVYLATQIANMSAYLTQTVEENSLGAYSRSEIGFGAEIKPRKREVERPEKPRIGFRTH